MILWRNIEILHFFIILFPTPDFPHFYYMLDGNLGSLLYGDVSVMPSFKIIGFLVLEKKILRLYHMYGRGGHVCHVP